MKQGILLAGAIAAILAVGAVWGGVTVWQHVRMNGLENVQATMTNDLNQRVFPGIQKRIEDLEGEKKPEGKK